jgi:hypothetical protein
VQEKFHLNIVREGCSYIIESAFADESLWSKAEIEKFSFTKEN